jgi:hypothetical protein
MDVFVSQFTTFITSQQTLTLPSRNILPDTPQPAPPRWKVDPKGSMAWNSNDSRVYYSDGVVWRIISYSAGVLTRTPLAGTGAVGDPIKIEDTDATGKVLIYNLATDRWIVSPSATFKGTTNLNLGSNSMSVAVTGTDNVALGVNSLKVLTSGINNISIGSGSHLVMADGSGNIGLGFDTISSAISSTNLIAIGASTMKAVTAAGIKIVGIGNGIISGAATANSIGIGSSAISNFSGSAAQIAIGALANTTPAGTAIGRIAIGVRAFNTGGGSGIMIGADAGKTVNTTNCFGIGANVFTNAVGNVLISTLGIGTNVGSAIVGTASPDIVAIGTNALLQGSACVVIGSNAGSTHISTTVATVAIGKNAAKAFNSTNGPVCIGNSAGTVVNTSDAMIAIGSRAGTSGVSSIMISIGRDAATATTGTRIIALGSSAAKANTSGNDIIAIGTNASLTAISETSVVAIGINALKVHAVAATTTNVIAIGTNALANQTTGTGCVAIGSGALEGSVNDTDCVAVGKSSLSTMSTAGGTNIAIGTTPSIGLTSGNGNILVGNTITSGNFSNLIMIGMGITSAAANDFVVPSANLPATALTDTMTVTIAGANGTITRVVSSRRFKKDIRDLEIDSSKIYEMKERTFEIKDGFGKEVTDFGFIAEEAEELGLEELVTYDYAPSGKIPSGFKYSSYSVLVNREMRKLKNKIENLKMRILSV